MRINVLTTELYSITTVEMTREDACVVKKVLMRPVGVFNAKHGLRSTSRVKNCPKCGMRENILTKR
ncbi:MAG TPA: hypothetical protein VNI84_18965 [Pyrinomonadaceae bacterium]|nr:hypothetical protein [Pyrinomonadaceae bacterium]